MNSPIHIEGPAYAVRVEAVSGTPVSVTLPPPSVRAVEVEVVGLPGRDGLALTPEVLDQIRSEIDVRDPDPGDLTILFDNRLV